MPSDDFPYFFCPHVDLFVEFFDDFFVDFFGDFSVDVFDDLFVEF